MPDAARIERGRASADPSFKRGRRTASRDADHIHVGLARIIEGEILPRLALAHRGDPQAWTTRAPTPEHIAAFAQALVAGEPSDEQVRALLADDRPLDALLLDLLAPAARHLGHLWEQDEADFVAVTVALGRLHALAHDLCAEMERMDVPANGRRILLLPCPGETHLFSLALVASFFREAGWGVVLADSAGGGPATLVRSERFDLIGISLSCNVHLPVMVDLVAGMRAASCHPDVRVIVGGPLFLREPACAAAIGADAAAEDGRSAVQIARALMLS
ncbi:cobalamin B12-binding domain-containing protein [Methylobacterium sp. NMS12]|uniref:cobalamin B12-binding domain-containing protein n=1 Tax=Methylobacterium sp. NMS12 TaxID=3079766 RepID=UPI003F881A63